MRTQVLQERSPRSTTLSFLLSLDWIASAIGKYEPLLPSSLRVEILSEVIDPDQRPRDDCARCDKTARFNSAQVLRH